jgi:hypothetical protein
VRFADFRDSGVGAHRPVRPSRAPIPEASYRDRQPESSNERPLFFPANVVLHHALSRQRGSAVPIPQPLLALFRSTESSPRKGTTLSPEPHYDADSDTYRHIYKGHPNATAVTNAEGITVFFDPDTHDVLGFQIVNFAEYYKAHQTPEGEFEIVLPARVPVNLEEEMDFDVDSLTSGVRIAEIY